MRLTSEIDVIQKGQIVHNKITQFQGPLASIQFLTEYLEQVWLQHIPILI